MAAISLPYTSKRLITIIHPDGGRIVSQINYWLANSGVEWTVNRLKAYRTAALQVRAGNHSIAKKIYQEESISYTRDDLLPRGVFRSVVNGYVNAQRPIVLRRLDVILRAYTAFRLKTLTPKQFNKAYKAITDVYSGHPDAIVVASELVESGAKALGLTNSVKRTKRSKLDRLKPGTSTHVDDRVPPSIRDLPYGKTCWSLLTSCKAPSSLMVDYPKADWYRRQFIDGWADSEASGHIAFLQEKGAKARVVAVPNAWNQWLFEPLHRLLDDLARDLQCSAVHDQNKGAWFIQERLPRKMACFDLSSATDRFPRAVQIHLLRVLSLDKYADALEEICQGWRISAPPHCDEELVDYGVGQPMGLYGSFPLFHLTHCCLLAGIAELVKKRVPDATKSYLVLGDDVLIKSHFVASRYSHIMRGLGVDLSPTKSIVSSEVAEFAGFVGVNTSSGPQTYRPYKHDDRGSVGNATALLHSVGSKLSVLPQWRKWIRAWKHTRGLRLPDLSPLVPDDQKYGVDPVTISPERFSCILSSCIATIIGEDSYDYDVDRTETPIGQDELMAELFDKQSPKPVTSLKDRLALIERHGTLEEPKPSPVVRLERAHQQIDDPTLTSFVNDRQPPLMEEVTRSCQKDSSPPTGVIGMFTLIGEQTNRKSHPEVDD